MLIFAGAFLMVFLAEFGDKSQLIAMFLAARYSARIVLAGVALATLLNNGIAVYLGYYLRASLNLDILQLAASAAFLFFGLWKISEKPEKEEGLTGEKSSRIIVNPFITATIILFMAEMGDKTQLATVSYVIKYNAPFLTLLGALAGMLLADGMGILAGTYFSRRLSERLTKLLSASLFIALGLLGFYSAAVGGQSPAYILLFIAAAAGLAAVLALVLPNRT